MVEMLRIVIKHSMRMNGFEKSSINTAIGMGFLIKQKSPVLRYGRIRALGSTACGLKMKQNVVSGKDV